MNLTSIFPHLIYQFKSEAELVKSIAEISQKFTTERERIADYLQDPRLVSAYAAFYLLTNMPKLEEVFKWLPHEWCEEVKSCDFIDLGAGPGTFSLAWENLTHSTGDFFQIELSPLMREQGLKLWHSSSRKTLHQGTRWQWNTSRPKVLFFGHSANEMGAAASIDYIEKINPDHILFIEPGTKSFFPVMLEIRDYLIQKKFSIVYPCPNSLACPLQSSDDWCHQFLRVKQDSEVERISQMAKLDRKLMPATVQAFSKTGTYQKSEQRLVRVLPETKFSFEWEVCVHNEVKHFQIMKRDLSKVEIKGIGAILAGASVETEIVKQLEKSTRVKLLKPRYIPD